GDVDPARLAGRKVIVGAQAVELRDFFLVPVHGVVSGAMLQALGAETLILDRALVTSGGLLSIAGALALVLVFGFGLANVRWTRKLIMLGLVAIAVECCALAVQAAYPVSLDTAAWHLTLVLLALVVVAREIDFRRILLAISSSKARNAETMLER